MFGINLIFNGQKHEKIFVQAQIQPIFVILFADDQLNSQVIKSS